MQYMKVLDVEARSLMQGRIAARYVESLGIAGAMQHTMNLATFCAGRSQAIELLLLFERSDAMRAFWARRDAEKSARR